jgi:hypothetical protein
MTRQGSTAKKTSRKVRFAKKKLLKKGGAKKLLLKPARTKARLALLLMEANSLFDAMAFTADGRIDADRLAATLSMTKADLAGTLGLPAEAFYRAERVEADKTQARLRELIEILNRVESWAGGSRQALAWYRGQGIASLGDETAEALVRTGRAGVVRAYLDQIAAGGFA